MRGWSSLLSNFTLLFVVLPAHAGVILTFIISQFSDEEYFPHMRGWSCVFVFPPHTNRVLPAHAGVILIETHTYQLKSCTSRTCGGDPEFWSEYPKKIAYFPHMRGWSSIYLKSNIKKLVLPAHAGVILKEIHYQSYRWCTSRTCGGDPSKSFGLLFWFRVLPAHAGVILGAQLNLNFDEGTSRTCGGDPIDVATLYRKKKYFPHMRGWSLAIMKEKTMKLVLPAHAGVIPNYCYYTFFFSWYFPHMRGWSQ